LLAFSLFFTSCGNGSTGGNNPDGAGDGITGGVIAQGIQVKNGTNLTTTTSLASLPNYTDTRDFGYMLVDYDQGISDSYTNHINEPVIVKINNGKLTLNLGIPKSLELLKDSWTVDGNPVTITDSNAKFWTDDNEYDASFYTSDVEYSLHCYSYDVNKGIFALSHLIYVDRDVTMTYGTTLNCPFKKGWNYFITYIDAATETYTSSTSLPSGFYWIVMNG
jgi:hypothetical protein